MVPLGLECCARFGVSLGSFDTIWRLVLRCFEMAMLGKELGGRRPAAEQRMREAALLSEDAGSPAPPRSAGCGQLRSVASCGLLSAGDTRTDWVLLLVDAASASH